MHQLAIYSELTTKFEIFYQRVELPPRANGVTVLLTAKTPQPLFLRRRVVARPSAVKSSVSPACSPSSMEGSSTMSAPRWKTPSYGAQQRRTLETTTRLATGDTALPTVLLLRHLHVPVEKTTLTGGTGEW